MAIGFLLSLVLFSQILIRLKQKRLKNGCLLGVLCTKADYYVRHRRYRGSSRIPNRTGRHYPKDDAGDSSSRP